MHEGHIHTDVLVLGGGASGLMAAAVAAARGRSVIVLEKNPMVGKKLNITGGGRCNITNTTGTTREFIEHYGEAAPYLHSPFAQFGVSDTFTFFEGLGLPVVVEANGRAFPTSHKATDVTLALLKAVQHHGGMVRTATTVQSIEVEHDRVARVLTDRGVFSAESVILATGGLSHPQTGSTGDGLAWLTSCGHMVHASNPSLVPLTVAERWAHARAGIAIDHMRITFYANDEKVFAKEGRLLFTHVGISGPLVLNSSKAVGELLANDAKVTARIDLFPERDAGTLDRYIVETIEQHKNKEMRNVLHLLAPAGMADTLFELLALRDPETKAHSFTHEDRRRLVQLLKALPLTIEGLMGLNHAIISDGGLDLDEVDTRTMRSRHIDNLYVTGDILNINRPSGGYSLQLCWTTGYVAGKHA
jgi:predicted Rossmann fold flavoprotein